MGQALRRAIGRLPSSVRTRPSPHPPPQSISRNTDHLPPPPPDTAVSVRDRPDASYPEDTSVQKVESNILEERDPEYDAMLQKMVGTIRSKPGGKLEMGEAFIVQKYRRPLPRVRSSVEESVSHGPKPLLPGTLTVAQLQEIMLLHQGRSAEHEGPMDIEDISRKFGVDVAQLEQIFQFITLPSEYQEKGLKNQTDADDNRL